MRCRPAVDFRGDCTLLYKGLGRCGRNAGSKAEAQAFALPFATTAFCVASDPDTEVAPDAMEHLTVPFADQALPLPAASELNRWQTLLLFKRPCGLSSDHAPISESATGATRQMGMKMLRRSTPIHPIGGLPTTMNTANTRELNDGRPRFRLDARHATLRSSQASGVGRRWRQEAASPRGGNWRDLYLTLAAECEHRATRISTESEWGSESTD
jgi:hypothetical protein